MKKEKIKINRNINIEFVPDSDSGMWNIILHQKNKKDELYPTYCYSLENAKYYGTRLIKKWIERGLI